MSLFGTSLSTTTDAEDATKTRCRGCPANRGDRPSDADAAVRPQRQRRVAVNVRRTPVAHRVIVFHVLGFLGEAVFWMIPALHGNIIPRVNPGLQIDVSQQAVVLRALLINQGVYNLLLAGGALAGLALVGRGQRAAGLALVLYTSVFAIGAGPTLLATTAAYVGGAIQTGLGIAALALTWRRAR